MGDVSADIFSGSKEYRSVLQFYAIYEKNAIGYNVSADILTGRKSTGALPYIRLLIKKTTRQNFTAHQNFGEIKADKQNLSGQARKTPLSRGLTQTFVCFESAQ